MSGLSPSHAIKFGAPSSTGGKLPDGTTGYVVESCTFYISDGSETGADAGDMIVLYNGNRQIFKPDATDAIP